MIDLVLHDPRVKALDSAIDRLPVQIEPLVTQPVVAGLIAGAWGAMMLGNSVGALLFEVRAHDPGIMSAVLTVVGGVAVAACGLAIRRGMSTDPAAVLQQE